MNSTATIYEQCCYRCVNSDFYLMKIPKKKAKKLKKLKNTIIASFQAKISWERPRKREKKIRSDEFLPDPQ